MQINKRFLLSAAWVVSLHVLTLAFLSLFRLVEYLALGGMVADSSASVLPAFVRGVWFDNVIACYITLVPLAVTLIAAAVSVTRTWMRKATVWWYGILGSVAFMASAANIPYFAYFFKNINSSIFVTKNEFVFESILNCNWIGIFCDIIQPLNYFAILKQPYKAASIRNN